MVLQQPQPNPFVRSFEKMAEQVQETYRSMDVVQVRSGWILLLCAIIAAGVIGLLVLGIVYTRRQANWVKEMTRINIEHGGITDRQQQRTVRAGDQVEQVGKRVTAASVGAAKLAKGAAEKTDEAAKKFEEAIGVMDQRISTVATELHLVAGTLNRVVHKLFPDPTDSIHGDEPSA